MMIDNFNQFDNLKQIDDPNPKDIHKHMDKIKCVTNVKLLANNLLI